MASTQKNSLLIKNQLPDYIRGDPDYNNFVLFLEAYYEWLEANNNVNDRAKNLLNYADIDRTTNEFIDYFINQFIPYFPEGALIDKAQAIKFAKQIYETKGTPASYKFLFRILYNSDVDIFYTKDAVFKASSGTWFVPKSIKLSTDDARFLNIKNYRILGENTKSLATIENSVLVNDKIELYISNIQRLFNSGEYVTVVDNKNQPVIVNGSTLRAKIVGQISQINIDPANRGLLYQVNDPVIVYGGLNANVANPIGATAKISEVTKGSIQRINVNNPGYGYSVNESLAAQGNAFTTIVISNAPGANAQVISVDPDPKKTANVTLLPYDTINSKVNVRLDAINYNFSNVANSNVSTTLANAFTMLSFPTYPIGAISVVNGGGGITQIPLIDAQSKYKTYANGSSLLKSVGILAPVQILNGGSGYANGEIVIFNGGNGFGAQAEVTVNTAGSIIDVEYTSDGKYPKGGMGYRPEYIPTASIQSFGSNAQLFVPGILGDTATFSVVVDRAGSITKIDLLQSGEDYEEQPNVSLRVQDIVVSNVNISFLPQKDQVVYQGTDANNYAYLAYVNSVDKLVSKVNPAESLYNLRVYNYTGNPNPNETIKLSVANTDINLIMANSTPAGFESVYTNPGRGLRNYGDGNAKATTKFLDGLVIGQGQYLDKNGQPSSYSLLQSEDYNNYTYILTVEKEISKYKSVLLNLLHPSGLKVIGKYRLNSNVEIELSATTSNSSGKLLSDYTGYNGSTANVVTNFTNQSNNIIHFNNLVGANIGNFIFANSSIIEIREAGRPYIYGLVTGVDSANSNITVESNTYLTFANVASVTANNGSNTINIVSLTNRYNVFNNGTYSNTAYPLKDIVYAGDYVLVANNTEHEVLSVDYINGVITIVDTFSANANSYLSVRRTIATNNVRIFGTAGIKEFAAITTEDGQVLTTEQEIELILG